MLPDYPKLKADLSARLIEYLESKVNALLGPLGKVRHVRISEGRSWRITRPSGESESSTLGEFKGQVNVDVAELPGMGLPEVLTKLDEVAEQMAKQMAEHTYRTISDAVDRAGHTVDAKGKKPSAEVILEALSSMHIDFDHRGKPRMPEIHFHPKLSDAMKLAIEALESDPALKQRFDEVMERKHEEWRAREASRSLVG